MGEIYCIRNKINGKCYVGQTIEHFNRRYCGGRWWVHTSNELLKRSIKFHGYENFEVEILERELNTRQELNQKEIYWADKLSSYHPNGFNLRGCGDQLNHTEFTKDKFRKPVICSNGKTYNSLNEAADDFNVKVSHISIAIRQKNVTHVKGCTFAFLGNPLPEPPKNFKLNWNKPRVIFDSNGNRYKSIKEASRILNIREGNINSVLSGKRSKAGGLKFRYDGLDFIVNEKKPVINKKSIKVECLTNGAIFDSLTAAGKFTGLLVSSISRKLRQFNGECILNDYHFRIIK